MKANQADFAIQTMARVLGVSRSGYYDWSDRKPAKRVTQNADLLNQIKQSHSDSDGSYGRPRVMIDLHERGYRVNHKRVGRLMRRHGIRGVCRRRGYVQTTRKDRQARVVPDLVNRQFKASAPNQLWVADITFIPTWQGFVYLATVLDVWSRRIVGWSMGETMPAELAVAALDMALQNRQPERVIHHSDQGGQYTSALMKQRCTQAGVQLSMGNVGTAYDNAMAESLFATLECELIERRSWKTRTQAYNDVFSWIEGWYNPKRRHSALGYLSPVQFERQNQNLFEQAQRTLRTAHAHAADITSSAQNIAL
jgi:putative transposase